MSDHEFDLDNLSDRDKRLARESVARVADAESNACIRAAMLWPRGKIVIPTVRQGPTGAWYRVMVRQPLVNRSWLARFGSRDEALSGLVGYSIDWYDRDHKVVANLLTLPRTEKVFE